MKRNRRPEDNEGHIHLHVDEDSPLSPDWEGQTIRKNEKKHDKSLSVILILAVAVIFVFFCSILLVVPWDQFFFTPAWVFEHIQQRFTQFYLLITGSVSGIRITVLQYLAAILVGAALAACGSIFQGAFRNVLAGPSTMGVMSGGTLGCLIYMLLFVSAETTEVTWTTFDLAAYLEAKEAATIWTTYAQQLCTLAGSLAGVSIILIVATAAGRGKLSASAMVISGSVFSHLISQVSMVIQYYMILVNPDDERIELMQELMMGSFDNVTSLEYLLMMGIPIIICLGVLIALSGKLNLLSLGEDEAQTMGVDLNPLRYAVIGLGTVLTAVVVSFCGQIGFMGFMIPLVGRKLVGPDMRRLLPASLCIGAIIMMLVLDLATITGMATSLNLFTSCIGSVVMICTLFTRKGGVRRESPQGPVAPGMGMH